MGESVASAAAAGEVKNCYRRLTLGDVRGDNGEDVAALREGEAAAGMLEGDVATERASMRAREASGVDGVEMDCVVRPLEHPRVRFELMMAAMQASQEVCWNMLKGGAMAPQRWRVGEGAHCW